MKKIKLTIRYLYEFYYRITHVITGIVLIFAITYIYKQTIIYVILPAGITHFITTDITEIFFSYIRICSVITLFVTNTIIIIQIYLFINPGLYFYESKHYFIFVLTTILIYLFVYIKLYPSLIQLTWEFFLSYTTNFNSLQINFEPKFTNYINYAIRLSTILILIYPLIIISFFITKLDMIILIKYRSLIYLLIFLIAAIITPPDPFSQLLIGLVLCLLYELRLFTRVLIDHYKKTN